MVSEAESSDDVLVSLPDELRSAFKDPLGTLYTDADELLAEVDGPIVTVGDIVTYHLEAADHRPDVAIVDGRTERQAVEEHVSDTLDARPNQIDVSNPPATLTADLVSTIRDAIDADEPTTIVVDGEEDLATIPAVLAAANGTTVVYGQPGEGMVAVSVTDDRKETFRELLGRMDGDPDRTLSCLDR